MKEIEVEMDLDEARIFLADRRSKPDAFLRLRRRIAEEISDGEKGLARRLWFIDESLGMGNCSRLGGEESDGCRA